MDHARQGSQSQLLSGSTDWAPRRAHLRRLRALWRSAGWPSLDAIEIDLLAAGLIERVVPPAGSAGAETLRLTDLGLVWLKRSLEINRSAFDPHEGLVRRVATSLQAQGRIVWTGLCLRAPIQDAALPDGTSEPNLADDDLLGPVADEPVSNVRWRLCRPDVFSIRNTSDPARLSSRIDEIKSHRSDLLGELRRPDKRAAYFALADECWYVLGADKAGRPIADPSELPPECGVLLEEAGRFRVARPAPRRASKTLPFAVWMALARAVPFDLNPTASEDLLLGPEPAQQPLAPGIDQPQPDRFA